MKAKVATEARAAGVPDVGNKPKVRPSVPLWAEVACAAKGCGASVCSSEKDGRFLVASRSLKEGEVVMTEAPLASAVQHRYRRDLCHRCLGPNPKLGCGKCRFALWCSAGCQNADRRCHADECAAIRGLESQKKTYIKTSVDAPLAAAGDISGDGGNDASGMRLLLRLLGAAARAETRESASGGGSSSRSSSSSTGVRRALRELEAHEEIKDAAVGSRSSLDRAVAGLQAALTDSEGPLAVAAEGGVGPLPFSEMKHAVGAVRTNGFVVTDIEGRRLGNAVFALASLLNHTCRPNVAVGFDSIGGGSGANEGLVLTVRALRPIESGEQLSIGYTELYRPVMLRREALEKSKGFKCTCSRCVVEEGCHDATVTNEEMDGGCGEPSSMNQREAAVERLLRAAETATVALDTGNEEAQLKRCHVALLTVAKALRFADGSRGAGADPMKILPKPHEVLAVVQRGPLPSPPPASLERHHWLRFELHALATSCLLERPKVPLPPALFQALLPSAGSTSSKSPLAVLVHHARLALTCALDGGAYDATPTPDEEKHRRRRGGGGAGSRGSKKISRKMHHPRLALCRRNLGNALMLSAAQAAAVAAAASSTRGGRREGPAHGGISGGGLGGDMSSPSQLQAATMSREAAAEYGRAAEALDVCWGKAHADTVALRKLEAWARSFAAAAV